MSNAATGAIADAVNAGASMAKRVTISGVELTGDLLKTVSSINPVLDASKATLDEAQIALRQDVKFNFQSFIEVESDLRRGFLCVGEPIGRYLV